MDARQPSQTADGAAIMRALHQQLPAEERVLDDPVAALLVDTQSDAFRTRVSLVAQLPETVRLRLTNFVLRSRFVEDCLAQAAQAGIVQYVILGAGLDTFAYRQPSWAQRLRIFEVDHPATQKMKQSRLRDAGIFIPDNVFFTAVDFENTTLDAGLRQAFFDASRPAFFSMLGVSQYLAADALDSTVKFVLSMPKSSEMVLTIVLPDHLLPSDEAALAASYAARFAAIGEPWLTRPAPDEFLAKLRSMGFSQAHHLSPEEANKRYFSGRTDGLKASLQEQMVRAVV
ncbi:class I SAM-dependent methyltransferase [Roseomonas sp. HF4]|uniref:class I SAM-dependent methyltransferase n=1 Tax=Roseomonas sp. HF4 TaxID=2562313 RepID=UPI0010C034D3|nr:class I SAM-dependent methyltransferase [Roseomonas sp. HF4]